MGMSQIPSRRGFTLIELLVVVMIISLLSAMLIPAMAMVKGIAQSTRCVSNQRQLGTMFGGFAQVQNGYYPPWQCWTWDSTKWWGIWPWYLDELAGVVGKSEANAFHCPAHFLRIQEFTGNSNYTTSGFDGWGKQALFTSSYGMNSALHRLYLYNEFTYPMATNPWNPVNNTTGTALPQMLDAPFNTQREYRPSGVRASQTILLAERWGYDGSGPEVNGLTYPPYLYAGISGARRTPTNGSQLRLAHRGRSAYLMFDLHVELLRPEQTYTPATFSYPGSITTDGAGGFNRWLNRN